MNRMPPKAFNIQEDLDPLETTEWLHSLEQTINANGALRGQFLINALLEHTERLGLGTAASFKDALTPHVNTIKVEDQGIFPGDLAVEERLASLMRWNALAMVVRANGAYGELGGHIASYASAADLFEVGFNHFFKARSADQLEGLTLRLVSMPEPFWKGDSPRWIWPITVKKLQRPLLEPKGSAVIPILGSCLTFGSSLQDRWELVPSVRSTMPASCAISRIANCSTAVKGKFGASLGTVRWMSPRA